MRKTIEARPGTAGEGEMDRADAKGGAVLHGSDRGPRPQQDDDTARSNGGLGPRFDHPLAPNGYAWWYLDALSDDGRTGVVVIGMLGNSFSPYYAQQRERGPADPLDFVTINAVVYRGWASRWALTESRGAERDATSLVIGRSAMRWSGGALIVDLNEITVPIPRPIKGQITLHPQIVDAQPWRLDEPGLHRWWPIAPRARVDVDLVDPRVQFSGTGYLDCNIGQEPLEAAFDSWTWSRVTGADRTFVSYSAERRNGSRRTLDLDFQRTGTSNREGVAPRKLGRTVWGIDLDLRADPSDRVVIEQALENTPFYARSQLRVQHGDELMTGTHEALSLRRFASPWVQWMLPYRMRKQQRGG